MTAVESQPGLRLSFTFALLSKEERCLQSSLFSNSSTGLIRTWGQVKVASPDESGRIVTHEKCRTFPMEITKEGAQSLRMKMPNAQLSLKEASYLRLYLLAARLPELTSKLERKCQMPSCIWKKLQLFIALHACSKIARTNVKVGKKVPNAQLYLKEATVIYSFTCLQQDCPN